MENLSFEKAACPTIGNGGLRRFGVELSGFAALILVFGSFHSSASGRTLGEQVKTLMAGPHVPSFWFSTSGWDPRICISNNRPGNAGDHPGRSQLENHCSVIYYRFSALDAHSII